MPGDWLVFKPARYVLQIVRERAPPVQVYRWIGEPCDLDRPWSAMTAMREALAPRSTAHLAQPGICSLGLRTGRCYQARWRIGIACGAS